METSSLSRRQLIDKGFCRCAQCGAVKPISEFMRNSKNYGGVGSYCKECNRAQFAAYNASRKASAFNVGAGHAPVCDRVVSRNGVPVQDGTLPRRLRSVQNHADVAVRLKSGIDEADDVKGANPLFDGIPSWELIEELRSRGFLLNDIARAEVQVVWKRYAKPTGLLVRSGGGISKE